MNDNISDFGRVLTYGKGTFGRLGTGDEENQYSPVQLPEFGGGEHFILDVVCGAVLTACINGANFCSLQNLSEIRPQVAATCSHLGGWFV